MHSSGKNSPAAGLSPYIVPWKKPPFQASLKEVFSCKYAWLVGFTNSSQKISTHLLLLWRWFCLVSYSPVTPYLQGIHGFWKFVAVHQKSSFFRNLGSKLASDSTPERKIKYFIDYGTYTFGVPFLFPVVQKWTAFFIPKIERRKRKYE